ncbi:MAG TPA: hypothetical protein VHB25_15470 [Gemmatimonadaceae bacterium]|nr:hypothetical protein [Gemmatimonadaceae bacterium]
MTRRGRIVAWVVILGLAAFQAYAQRYAISPDGISYLDMSDGVVTGDWSRLVNLYWSPLYPAVVGLARVVLHAGPATEVPALHAANLVCFVGLLAAFEFLLIPILELANRTHGPILGRRWAGVVAYVLFGFFALTMTPLELPTPDLLASAAVLVAFGVLLRACAGRDRDTGLGIVLGVALGAGALAKSFLVPWGIVCLVTFAIVVRRTGFRPLAAALVAWALFVVPLTVVLSRRAGRLTFGDAGRLTYAWYVNQQDVPSLGIVPSGARRASTDMILPGTGATGPAPGTDPMWYDPARWNAAIRPHFSVSDELGNVRVFLQFYLTSFAPLLLLIFLVACAPPGTRRECWYRGWPVYLPAIAGLAGYGLVIVTARYVMGFTLGALLVALATLPRPRRLIPVYAALGLALCVALEARSPELRVGLALITWALAAMIVGGLARPQRRLSWAVVVVTVLVARVVLRPSPSPLLAIAGAALVILFWMASRAAIRRRRPVRFAQGALGGLLVALVVTFGLRFFLRARADVAAAERAASPEWGNVSWSVARALADRGIGPGTRIALIGEHAQAYWARTARLNIVASVPGPIVQRFWNLPAIERERLLNEFAAAGAQVAIASEPPAGGVPDSSWTPVPYRGWIRRLAPIASR